MYLLIAFRFLEDIFLNTFMSIGLSKDPSFLVIICRIIDVANAGLDFPNGATFSCIHPLGNIMDTFFPFSVAETAWP